MGCGGVHSCTKTYPPQVRNAIDILQDPHWIETVAKIQAPPLLASQAKPNPLHPSPHPHPTPAKPNPNPNPPQAAFNYLRNRLTNNCDAAYHCTHLFEIARVIRMFDPSFVVSLSPAMVSATVDALVCVTPIALMVPQLRAEVAAYVAEAAYAGPIDRADQTVFTNQVLTFWRHSKLKHWCAAARIVFSIPFTSASSERVFAALKLMWGEQQLRALTDQVETGLMLHVNRRALG